MNNNQEILDNIKRQLTKDKSIDIPYLEAELKIYKAIQNEEIVFAISQLLYSYLSKDEKAEYDLKAHEVLNDRHAEYVKSSKLIDNNQFEEAKQILQKLIKTYEKMEKVRVENYFDFEQMIEYVIYCENVKRGRNLNIKRFPEPVTYFYYQLAFIESSENHNEQAIAYLEKALLFNPRAMYVIQELIVQYQKTEQFNKLYELCNKALIYAYTKEQFGFLYQMLGNYFIINNKYDIAIACLVASDQYYQLALNKELVTKIMKETEVKQCKSAEEVINIFKEYNLSYGPSRTLVEAVNDFVKYLITIKDFNGAIYLLTIMIELTDSEFYKKTLNQLEKEKNKNEEK